MPSPTGFSQLAERLCIAALLCFTVPSIAAVLDQPLHELRLDPDLWKGEIAPPYWDRGFLFIRHFDSAGGGPQLSVIGRDGKLVLSVRIDFEKAFPGAAEGEVRDGAAVDSHGNVVVSAIAVSSAGQKAAMLCFIDQSGELRSVIRTNPCSPQQVRVAADGSIWALGVDLAGTGKNTEVFWRFDRDGKLLGKYLPRKEFQTGGWHPAMISKGGRPFLVTSADRVGAYIPIANEWVEFQPGGTLVGRWKIPLPPVLRPNGSEDPEQEAEVTYLAMTSSNRVFAGITAGDTLRLHQLDRQSSRWTQVPLENVGRVFGEVYGAEGEALIVAHGGAEPFRFGWFLIPSESPVTPKR